jgi:hypothetical protein
MLKIAKSNSKTSNNSIRLAAAALAVNIARLIATTLAITVAATPLKLITLAIPIIATPFKCNACKAIRDCAANSASWSNYIKGVLGKLINLIVKKF